MKYFESLFPTSKSLEWPPNEWRINQWIGEIGLPTVEIEIQANYSKKW